MLSVRRYAHRPSIENTRREPRRSSVLTASCETFPTVRRTWLSVQSPTYRGMIKAQTHLRCCRRRQTPARRSQRYRRPQRRRATLSGWRRAAALAAAGAGGAPPGLPGTGCTAASTARCPAGTAATNHRTISNGSEDDVAGGAPPGPPATGCTAASTAHCPAGGHIYQRVRVRRWMMLQGSAARSQEEAAQQRRQHATLRWQHMKLQNMRESASWRRQVARLQVRQEQAG